MSGDDALLAAVQRIQLWLELHPNTVNVANEIGSSDEFKSDTWAYRMYAINRKDLTAVLELAEKTLKGRT